MQRTKHKECGFRDKVDVCRFRPEDCNPEQCDMYDIPFTAKDIHNRAIFEKAEARKLKKELKKYKKEGNTEQAQIVKKKLRDKHIGGTKLLKAYLYCKRRGI